MTVAARCRAPPISHRGIHHAIGATAVLPAADGRGAPELELRCAGGRGLTSAPRSPYTQ